MRSLWRIATAIAWWLSFSSAFTVLGLWLGGVKLGSTGANTPEGWLAVIWSVVLLMALHRRRVGRNPFKDVLRRWPWRRGAPHSEAPGTDYPVSFPAVIVADSVLQRFGRAKGYCPAPEEAMQGLAHAIGVTAACSETGREDVSKAMETILQSYIWMMKRLGKQPPTRDVPRA
jgi:hypothetical protein